MATRPWISRRRQPCCVSNGFYYRRRLLALLLPAVLVPVPVGVGECRGCGESSTLTMSAGVVLYVWP